ncbi:uncharacterized protein B0H18DRAFT_878822, partial [Fomitopsis serialis]|uniref:uncharacterized protein n=1 Tax=Fomitopsis serialis TaxID=139415 RepID=UPI002008A96A
KCSFKTVKGIMFRYRGRAGQTVRIPTIVPRMESQDCPRFPSVEVVLGAERQFHETWVELQEGSKTRRFFVAAYYDPGQPVNRALKAVAPQVDWHGELIVMKGGAYVFVTDIGPRGLAYRAILKCVPTFNDASDISDQTRYLHVRYLNECIPMVQAALAQGRPIGLPIML